MNNLYAVVMIMIGTYICSSNPDAFLIGSDYDFSFGLILAVVIYGTFALIDLIIDVVKSSLSLIKEWLK
jgi:hypothetical protein